MSNREAILKPKTQPQKEITIQSTTSVEIFWQLLNKHIADTTHTKKKVHWYY